MGCGFRQTDGCGKRQAGRGPYANTTAMAGRIYRLDVGGVTSGPYNVDNGSI